MSWMAAGWVKHCRLGNANRKATMLVIADYATEDGGAVGVDVPEGHAVCWASIAEIARNAELGESTVRRILADMEAAGVIERHKRGRKWGIGGRTTDLIFLNYSRPFVTVGSTRPAGYRSDRAVTPVDAVVDDASDAAAEGEGYRSLGGGLALDSEGVSARLVNAQNLQPNHQLTDNNLPVDHSGTDRATRRSKNGSSSLVGAAPSATARPPPGQTSTAARPDPEPGGTVTAHIVMPARRSAVPGEWTRVCSNPECGWTAHDRDPAVLAELARARHDEQDGDTARETS